MKNKKKSAFRQKIKPLTTVVKLHNSVQTVKLRAFINVVVKRDYSGLIIIGQPTIEQLQDAWIDILSEYQQARKDPALDAAHEERQERAVYENRKELVSKIILMLRERFDARLIDILTDQGFDYEFEEDIYLDDLLKVEAELESEAMYLEQSEETKELPTEKHYLSTLIQIQKTLKACPMLTPMQMMDNLTVAEYVEYCNHYDEYIASLTPKEEIEDGD